VPEDVGGLEVTVNDPGRVQVLKARGDVHQHRHDLGLVHRDGGRGQRAIGQGHDQQQGVTGVSRVDDRQEHLAAAIGNALADVDLAAQETVIERSRRALLLDHLDRHGRSVRPFGGINAAEAARRAERLAVPVPPRQAGLAGKGHLIGHCLITPLENCHRELPTADPDRGRHAATP
jgi:hypothetical protein